MQRIDSRLEELSITLPDAPAPIADYVPYVKTGSLLFVSGQIPVTADGMITGKLGANVSIEEGQHAAHICGINLLSQLKAACDGDLDRVKRVVKLGGFVNCTPDFNDHPKVINGTSSLMVAVFGVDGKHARAAVGAPSLPMDAAVEVDGVFEIS